MSGVIARAIGASVVGTLARGAIATMAPSALKSSLFTVDLLPKNLKGVAVTGPAHRNSSEDDGIK